MTDKISDKPSSQDELFELFLDAADDYEYGDIIIACLEMIVSVAKSSEDDNFARSLVPMLISAAHYLERTGAQDSEIEESPILLLN